MTTALDTRPVRIRVPAAPARGALRSDPQRRDRAVLAGLTVLAVALRVPTLGRGYWVDEGISVGIASHPLRQIPSLLRLDGSPPLFYVVLHFWIRLFGRSEVATHLLPLLTSVAVIPVAWWCAGTLFGRRAAVWAAVLAATNPFLAWYATETRMYTLVVGLAMVATTFAVRATRTRRIGDVAGAATAYALLLYTHSWAPYLVAVSGIVFLGRALRRRDRAEAVTVIAAGTAVALAYLPWVPTLLDQARHTAAPWAVAPSIGDFWADPSSILGGTLGVLIEPLLGVTVILTWRRVRSRPVALLLAISIGTITAGWLVAQADPSWATRYLGIALGPLLLAIAGTLSPTRVGRRVMGVAAVILVVWSLVGSLLPDSNARFAKSNVAAVARAARPALATGDLVIVTQTEQLAAVAHYLPSGLSYATPTGSVGDPTVVDWRDLVSRLQHADPCRTIAPLVDSLPVGAHVLLVNPFKNVGATGTLWSRTVNAEVVAVNRLLLGDPGLTAARSFMQATSPKPFSPVTGLMFTKGTGRTDCPTPA